MSPVILAVVTVNIIKSSKTKQANNQDIVEFLYCVRIMKIKIFLCVCGTDWYLNSRLTLGRQTLYHLSHASSLKVKTTKEK
jgi:NADH:ubiquinone oxidoreductase subunit C